MIHQGVSLGALELPKNLGRPGLESHNPQGHVAKPMAFQSPTPISPRNLRDSTSNMGDSKIET